MKNPSPKLALDFHNIWIRIWGAFQKPLLQHTWEAVCQSQSVDQVVIATNSEKVRTVAASFGAMVVLTGEHKCGTDRIAEVASGICSEDDLILNVQGDEVGIRPSEIETLIAAINSSPEADMGTLAIPIRAEEQILDPSCVKVVFSELTRRAIYFSRSPIPYWRTNASQCARPQAFLHIGVYGFRHAFLRRLTQSPATHLEKAEMLEQLRALELGAHICVGIVDEHVKGIDTLEDYERHQAIRRAT
ncbi:3-deoxy-manno-octulosonate cytidylyltransferase [Blastopirellula marina]|uniref:3-deoxy-manno-octulosonate cytidylyltransferase n=1 Tax=Blastopirellula marina DSM 3645 TaxID=314230 RepID=A4A254_9BACT|nr:3-deoxy-manno-octulosonate cytidylyltransferase [Blastopirellula marina]EAQ77157.1 3-deoxy-manno-octulosonate cytidylyltransferase [Blastopirellula marina DSM 3645]